MNVLNGKVAVISGGTSGIGARTAELFVAEGASVVIGGRRELEGKELAGRLGSRARFVQTDVTVESDVERLIGQTVEEFWSTRHPGQQRGHRWSAFGQLERD